MLNIDVLYNISMTCIDYQKYRRSDMSLNYIFRRRSIRKYTDEPVSNEKIKSILEAAMAAPSAHNYKPWHFIVIKNRSKLDHIADIHPYGKMLYHASLAIAVCGNKKISPDLWIQDCSAVTENILLALPELGLGGVWLGCYPIDSRKNAVKELLSLPDEIELLSIIAIGYPAEDKKARTQFDEKCIHYEKW